MVSRTRQGWATKYLCDLMCKSPSAGFLCPSGEDCSFVPLLLWHVGVSSWNNLFSLLLEDFYS